jgi:hypothetical protein
MFKAALPLLLIAALLMSPSCIFDPKEDPVIPPDDPIEWPDMTQRDHVIQTVMLCYANPKNSEAVEKYNGLLHSEYFFGLAEGDVQPGEPPIMDRAVDIKSTEGIFEFESLLELTITPETGSWYEYFELEGEPCENCYASERQYFIRAQFGDEETIWQSPVGKAFMSVIVSPDESDPNKWVLRAIYDLCIIEN